MKELSEEHSEFTRQLEGLGKIISNATACFSAWYALTNIDKNTENALNRYSGFFRTAQVAFMDMALLELAKVFDKHPDSVSIRQYLLTAAVNDPEFLSPDKPKYSLPHFEEEDQQLEERLKNDLKEMLKKIDNENYQTTLNKLKYVRDKHLAHHDKVIRIKKK